MFTGKDQSTPLDVDWSWFALVDDYLRVFDFV